MPVLLGHFPNSIFAADTIYRGNDSFVQTLHCTSRSYHHPLASRNSSLRQPPIHLNSRTATPSPWAGPRRLFIYSEKWHSPESVSGYHLWALRICTTGNGRVSGRFVNNVGSTIVTVGPTALLSSNLHLERQWMSRMSGCFGISALSFWNDKPCA